MKIGKILMSSLVMSSALFIVNAYNITGHTDIKGYAWSDNIGWLSMSCKDNNSCATSNYGVLTNQTTGAMSGYAWSDNIGWVSFNAADVASCPQAPCAPTLTTTGLTGFAKALAGGTLGSGGWDGYISLNGVTRTSDSNFGGYAWGSDVVGWLSMTGVSFNLTCGEAVNYKYKLEEFSPLTAQQLCTVGNYGYDAILNAGSWTWSCNDGAGISLSCTTRNVNPSINVQIRKK